MTLITERDAKTFLIMIMWFAANIPRGFYRGKLIGMQYLKFIILINSFYYNI